MAIATRVWGQFVGARNFWRETREDLFMEAQRGALTALGKLDRRRSRAEQVWYIGRTAWGYMAHLVRDEGCGLIRLPRHRRDAGEEPYQVVTLEDHPSQALDPQAEAIANLAVREFLQSLDDDHRELVEMLRNGDSETEIAGALGLSPWAIRRRRQHLAARLRRLLRQN